MLLRASGDVTSLPSESLFVVLWGPLVSEHGGASFRQSPPILRMRVPVVPSQPQPALRMRVAVVPSQPQLALRMRVTVVPSQTRL
ncbi:hypothetical protein CesoFtcFv8_014231 [Champsocephalus esox]|uniref:Uncharacterized protein n=1 Tax=Champsocephalus esox TaxID=159716 RepID=A0AAN8BSN3_9TELE|nr:hypothetical protein CesoFtcFv8_014231 [Champsocephalus esox]